MTSPFPEYTLTGEHYTVDLKGRASCRWPRWMRHWTSQQSIAYTMTRNCEMVLPLIDAKFL